MDLLFFRKPKTTAWVVETITEDRRPVAVYTCPTCKTVTYFDLKGNGAVPDAKCCAKREPFPVELSKHLTRKPKYAAEPRNAVRVL